MQDDSESTPSFGQDPVVNERIEEALERERQEIREYDEAIEELKKNIASSPLPEKILIGLGLRKSPEQDRLEKLIAYRNSIEKYSLPAIPDKVRRQIKLNRDSNQLFELRRFLSDPISTGGRPSFLAFPYDGGELDREERYKVYGEDRTFSGPGDILKAAALSAINDETRTIILYDTSSQSPQPRYETVIDALVQLGFAVDESEERSARAVLADTGLDPQALEEFQGRALTRPGHRMTDPDWIQKSSDGTATGFLRIVDQDQGHPDDPSSIKSSPLTELRDKWKVGHLLAELKYERTPLDTKLSLRVDSRKLNIVTAEAVFIK